MHLREHGRDRVGTGRCGHAPHASALATAPRGSVRGAGASHAMRLVSAGGRRRTWSSAGGGPYTVRNVRSTYWAWMEVAQRSSGRRAGRKIRSICGRSRSFGESLSYEASRRSHSGSLVAGGRVSVGKASGSAGFSLRDMPRKQTSALLSATLEQARGRRTARGHVVSATRAPIARLVIHHSRSSPTATS